MIGFARWLITQEPQNKRIIGKYLGAVPESDMELCTFWPDSSIQHCSLIK